MRSWSPLMALAAGTTMTAPALAAKPPMELQRLTAVQHIDPIRIAPVKYVNGQIVIVGDWVPYSGGSPRSAMYNAPLYDSFGRGWGPNGMCFPPGTNCPICGGTASDDGARWYFGPTYNNPDTVDNLQSFVGDPCKEVDEVDAGFYFGVNVPTGLLIAHFVFEQFTGFDPVGGTCTDPSSYTTACGGNGVLLDFGTVPPPPSPAYYAYCADGLIAAGIGMLMPSDDSDGDGLVDGSHAIFYLLRNPVTGALERHPGPVQPMLWGTGEDSGEARPGTHSVDSYDDDNPTDGMWDPSTECYDYTAGLCPDPLGKMVVFLAPFCPADYNRDGFVDGIDYDGFNNDFESGNPRADFNNDCFVDGIDSDMFNNEFESPCP